MVPSFSNGFPLFPGTTRSQSEFFPRPAPAETVIRSPYRWHREMLVQPRVSPFRCFHGWTIHANLPDNNLVIIWFFSKFFFTVYISIFKYMLSACFLSLFMRSVFPFSLLKDFPPDQKISSWLYIILSPIRLRPRPLTATKQTRLSDNLHKLDGREYDFIVDLLYICFHDRELRCNHETGEVFRIPANN